jgi:DNA modification methylase
MEEYLFSRMKQLDWTFRDIRAKEGIHGLHPYPAMMAPPVARRLIAELTKERDTVLDPFCGSGTVLVEAILQGRKAVGYDINPLALLISRVKTTPINPKELKKSFQHIEKRLATNTSNIVPNFPNINYWFKNKIITDLTKLKKSIEGEEEIAIRDFFTLIFARTVRQTSNTRGNEFKLYRLPEEKLKFYMPDVFFIFRKLANECIGLMEEFYSSMKGMKPVVNVQFFDSRQPFPLHNSVDLMLTSPPYGDSRTTVAYGQFSRLALQWLDLWNKDIDKESLGGKRTSPTSFVPSLRKVLNQIYRIDSKRCRDVEDYYQDLFLCIENISKVIKVGGFAVFVIANRKVKGTVLPTDRIIIEMMEPFGFKHLLTLQRDIPNKRMPLKNSPSNVAGQIDVTMLRENIIILQKN